jgi:hypothetical protein
MKTKPIKEEKLKYKQSETVVINRSQINFAIYNPKNHSQEDINKIKQNIKRVALLGGIVWNETTGNLIDGHKRIMALDIINAYDNTKETDYKIKVEKIALDEKTEKEQNIFQTKSRTELSNELLAILLPDIDIKLAGLDTEDINLIIAEVPNIEFGDNTEISDSFAELEQKSQEQKEQSKKAIKDLKKDIKDRIATENEGQSYFVVTFDNFDNKAQFMERYGFNQNDKYIKGEIFANVIDKILQ